MYFNPMNLSSLLRIEFAVFDQVGPYIFLISFIDIYIYIYLDFPYYVIQPIEGSNSKVFSIFRVAQPSLQ